jgi:glycosyltransferase involved in cell wall biosynthesis
MHVVQLVPSLAIAGMEFMVVHLASWLHARGVSVEVLSFERDESLARELGRRGVPVRRLHLAPYFWRFYPMQLIRHLRARQDLILHGHMYAWHKGIAVTRWLRAAAVYTQHGTGEDWICKEWGAMKRSARATQAAVAVSREVHEFLVDRLGIPPERAYHVPNGMPDIYQADRIPIDWGVSVPQGAPVVGMVSRLASPKDPDTLVQAMVLVRERVRDAQLVFIGGGPDEARLRQRVQERIAAGFVHLLGERRDVPQLLHHLDVFVLSSRSEGHSMAVLEAMSAERAIVATRVGGNVQLLDEGACGVLTPPGDPRAMADAIQRLLLDRSEAKRLAVAARRRFLEQFSVDKMGEAYLAIYREALARRAVR